MDHKFGKLRTITHVLQSAQSAGKLFTILGGLQRAFIKSGNQFPDFLGDLVANFVNALTQTVWRQKTVVDLLSFFRRDFAITGKNLIDGPVESPVKSGCVRIPQLIVAWKRWKLIRFDVIERTVCINNSTLELVFLTHDCITASRIGLPHS